MDCPALLRLAEAVDRGLLHSVGVTSNRLPDGQYLVGGRQKPAVCVHVHLTIDADAIEVDGKTVAEAAEQCEAALAKRTEVLADQFSERVDHARRLRNTLA